MNDEQTAVDALAKRAERRAKHQEIGEARDRYVELALPDALRYETYWQDLAMGYLSGDNRPDPNTVLCYLLDLNERLKKIEALMPPQECP